MPKFQRHYVWFVESWTTLWDDMEKAKQRDPNGQGQLLGVVLERQLAPATNTDQFQIVDGRQRLTTLQLLLVAARELATAQGLPSDIAAQFQRLCIKAMWNCQRPP